MAVKALFEGIDKRIRLDKQDSDAAYFQALSLKLEYITKLVTAGFVACISDDPDRHRYSQEYSLVRANSIGDWVETLNKVLVGPPAQYFFPGSQVIVKQFTERVRSGDWRYSAVVNLNNAIGVIGSSGKLGERVALRKFFEIGAHFRNRTRGHGATTTEQQSQVCPFLSEAIELVSKKLDLFELGWVYLHRNLSGKYRVSPLSEDSSNFDFLKRKNIEKLRDGVYIYIDRPVRVNLIFSDADLHDILLPNGNYKKNSFEVLSYYTNNQDRKDGNDWLIPSGQLPPSDTEGSRELELVKETLSNVPPVLVGYVARPDLVNKVEYELLQTDRHPILSLTGPGGIGKTTIAIAALQAIMGRNKLIYDIMLWISARDIDLMETGPKPVRPLVVTQDDIARVAVEILQPKEINDSDFDPNSYFEKCLRCGANGGKTIFVVDNFETVQNPADVYSWLDTHVRLPNKLLITTRIREFRADYPIEIGGMTDEQASCLIDQHSKRLGIQDLINPKYKMDLISEFDGHPYVMRILLGQVATQRTTKNSIRFMADLDHILKALFERTYSALSAGAQRVFLLLSSWKVYIPEVAIRAVFLRLENDRFNIEHALNQLHRFSLIERFDAEEDNHALVGVPLAASLFGQTKLKADMYRLSIEDDRKLLMEFGPGRGKNSLHKVLPRIENLYKSVASNMQTDPNHFKRYKQVLEYLAESLPTAYFLLSDLVLEIDDSVKTKNQAIKYLRLYLEVATGLTRKNVLKKLVELYRASQNVAGEFNAIVEAALLSCTNIEELSNFANRLNNRLRDLKAENNEEVRESDIHNLLRKVIEAMENQIEALSATDCSRLAWLYFNIGNKERASDIVRRGLNLDPGNDYCQRIVERLNV